MIQQVAGCGGVAELAINVQPFQFNYRCRGPNSPSPYHRPGVNKSYSGHIDRRGCPCHHTIPHSLNTFLKCRLFKSQYFFSLIDISINYLLFALIDTHIMQIHINICRYIDILYYIILYYILLSSTIILYPSVTLFFCKPLNHTTLLLIFF